MKFFPSFRLFLKINTLSFVFLFCFSYGFAQQSSKYSLLWEISGKGLQKPSYLFGSMHLKDKRIFNFSDSVMKAIEGSSAFVMEVHPDSVNKSFFDESAPKMADRDVLKILSAAQLDTLFKRFKEKNGFDADTATLNNAMLISALMKPDYTKPDDMPSFVDAYLFGIARTLKKKIFGLEKIQDQIDLMYETDEDILALFEDNEQEREYVEEMISVYARGNIYEIYDFLKDDEDELDDENNLVVRNKVMAAGIKELMKSENIFTTVGAAHLLGDEGIIALLKRDGYKLRPVQATFTGVAKNYNIDYAKMDWYNYKDQSFNYSIDFPSLPARKFEKGSSAVVVYSDLSNETIFTTTSSFTGPITTAYGESYLDTVAQSYLKNENIQLINKKKIIKDGVPALELEAKTENKYVRTLIQYNNNHFFTVSVEGPKNNLHEYFGNHFLDSFHSTKPIAISADNWIEYKNQAGAFSMKLPLWPEEIKKEVANPTYPDYPYQIYMYSATDQSKLINYIFRYNDFPAGLYLANKSIVFDALGKQFEGKGEVLGEPKKIYKDGYEGRAIEMVIQGYHMEAQMYIRGNRTYLLLKQNLNGKEKPADDQFFSSFKLEKLLPSATIPFTTGNLKLQLPNNPVTMPSDDEYGASIKDAKLYYAVNSYAGGVYGVQSATISKYAKFKAVDSLYKDLLEGIKSETDSLIKIEDVLVGNIKAKEYTAKDTLAGTEKRIKLWIDKDQFYMQTVLASKEELTSQQATDFFTNIKYTPSTSSFNLLTAKAPLIMADLKSADTTIYKAAFGALRYYEFDKEELPEIYKALKITYADDTSAYGVRGRLINNLSNLHDKTTIPFLKQLFEEQGHAVIRAKILGAIPTIDSTNYDWYLKKLLETPAFKIDDYWSLFSPLKDSTAFASKHFDEILTLMGDDNYRTQVLNLVSQMLGDEDNLKTNYIELIANKKELITAKAIADINAYITKPKEYPSNVYDYLNILSRLNLKPLADEFTNKVFKLDSAFYLHTTALATRIKMNLPLNQQMLNAQLDSLSTRYQIMQAFNETGKIKEVPLKYRKHEEFAKLLIYNYAAEEEYYPTEMKLLGKLKEADGTYYVFELSFDEDGETKKYIAIAGSFKDQTEDLDFKNLFGYMDFEEIKEDWQAQAKALITNYNESL